MVDHKKSRALKRGYPLPAGTTILKEGINFSLFSRHADSVTLVIDHFPKDAAKPLRYEFPLDPHENRTGDMWHILLVTKERNFRYGFRVNGPDDQTGRGLVYDHNRILIDPCSTILTPRSWGTTEIPGDQPCCLLTDEEFDWENDTPLKTPLSETIIYELHVRGFSRHPSSLVTAPGTFKAIIEKIPYLKALGITAVELMPVTEFDENDVIVVDPLTGEKLKNFWGYNPISFFALKSGYAADPSNAVNEFKTMVKTLHQAGIEVYLDMVFNHSGEGGYEGTTSSFRGIDNPIYYLLDSKMAYLNFSGCGNTMNCNHPIVRELIRKALRYWVTEMHIDGFRFDLASILGRDRLGNVLINPPMIEVISEDPVLRDTKMIAEAWDAAGLYQVGSFSSDDRWAEWNGHFRDDIRAFMRGDAGTITRLATRIAGSSDLYQQSGRSPLCSINFITSHDGFTLHDLVSYDNKNNLMNGEQNRDGENYNLSWNSGVEGETDDEEVLQLRLRRMKTFAVLLLLSQGVPMITAGDEFCRSQQGNNNAWCQDNPVGWLDWTLLTKNNGFFRFFQQVIALRKKYRVFRRQDFFKPVNEPAEQPHVPEISWQYLTPTEQNWAADCHALAFCLRATDDVAEDSDFFIMINGDPRETLTFHPPATRGKDKAWYQIIDTAADSPHDFHEFEEAKRHFETTTFSLAPFSCVVLQAIN